MQADPATQADFLISSGDKSKVADKNITIQLLLDRAAAEVSPERLEDSFPGQPLVQAEILGTIGRTYYGVSEAKLAVDHLRRAVALRQLHQGEHHEQTLHDLNDLGLSHREAGNAKEELRALRQVYETRLRIHPPEDPAVTASRVNLATRPPSGRRNSTLCRRCQIARSPEAIRQEHPPPAVRLQHLLPLPL